MAAFLIGHSGGSVVPCWTTNAAATKSIPRCFSLLDETLNRGLSPYDRYADETYNQFLPIQFYLARSHIFGHIWYFFQQR